MIKLDDLSSFDKHSIVETKDHGRIQKKRTQKKRLTFFEMALIVIEKEKKKSNRVGQLIDRQKKEFKL